MIRRFMAAGIRRTIGSVRRLQGWAECERTRAEAHSEPDDDGLALTSLNALFTKILSERNGYELRANYLWGVLQAAHLAKALAIDRISVIEFGVAGGNGLIALEYAAAKVEKALDVAVDVYGFDPGSGLPQPRDYRDLPSIWVKGAFSMDVERLKRALQKAELLLGEVATSVPKFLAAQPAPVGFVAFDLDYYSSTMDAFKLLEADPARLLPRIYCYFDDIMGHLYSEFTGERLAIREFNDAHPMRKIAPIYGLKYFLSKSEAQECWAEMMYLAHIFNHELYCAYDGSLKPSRYRSSDLRDDLAAHA
jgi:hypothetical protein